MQIGSSEVLLVPVALNEVEGRPEVLSTAERTRWDRMRSAAKRREFLVGRTVIRDALGAIGHTRAVDVRLELGRHGRPRATHPARLHFNLSHSGDQALLAIARRGPLGVDVEQTRPRRPFARLARRFFAAPEIEWLMSLPAAHRREGFYRLWTLKEAYLKALGTGLTVAANSFSVDAARPHLLRQAPGHEVADGWELQALPAPQGYDAALCTPAGVVDYRLMTVHDFTGDS